MNADYKKGKQSFRKMSIKLWETMPPFDAFDAEKGIDQIQKVLLSVRNEALEEVSREFMCKDITFWKQKEILKVIRSLKAKP